MDEEGIGLGVVPPSPVATSTQRSEQSDISRWIHSLSQSGRRNVTPLLPRLPDLPLGEIEIDTENEVDIVTGAADRFPLIDARRATIGLDAGLIIPVDDGSDVSSVDSELIEINDGSSDVQIVSDSDSDDSSTSTILPGSPSNLASNPASSAPGHAEGPGSDNLPVGGASNVLPLSSVLATEVEGSGQPLIDSTPVVPIAGSSVIPIASGSIIPNTGTSVIPVDGSSAVPVAGTSVISVAGTSVIHIASSSTVGNQDNRVTVQALGAGDSPAEFRQAKRKRVASPVKPAICEDNGEDDGDCCPICFESWTTSGIHRLSSLKCGHLFGQSCIEKWLKGQGGKCPHCNAKAKRQDVRVLYAKSIKALDTSERDRALRDLEKEREGKRKAEMDCAQLRLQYQMSIEENNRFKLEIEKLKAQIRHSGSTGLTAGPSSSISRDNMSSGSSHRHISGQFMLDKTIKIWDAGNCRVLAYCPSLATLVASQPSSSTLFPGFGVKKISTLDFKTSQYITIHSKAIRDLAFHPSVDDGMLLSCGLDKKVKMTSLLSNAVVQTYETPVPAWSCVWHAEDRNYFYAGLQNGVVMEFDIRNTEEAVREINVEGSRSPVASLCFMKKDMSANFRAGGLFIGKLDQVSFYEWLPSNTTKLHYLPLSGNLTSLHIEPNTRHLLASYRPTAKSPTIRHQLCEMISRNISAVPTVIDNVCSCNVIHTFHGGHTQTVLSKTTLIQHPGDDSRLLVCGSEEKSNSVHLWDSGTGQLTQRLLVGGACVDMCSFNINNTIYLATLTDKQCKVFKWS